MRSPLLRFGLLVVVIGGGLAVAHATGAIDWLRGQTLQETMQLVRGRWWTPLAMLAFSVVAGCLPVPLTPIVLAGGAVYGPLLGSLLNFLFALLGSSAGYLLARLLGRDLIEQWMGPDRWRRLDRMVADHGLYTMIRSRWLLPLFAPNFVAGLSGMAYPPFLLSSIVGLALPIALYSYVGHLLITTAGADPTHTLRNAALVVFAMLAVSLLPALVRRLRR